METQAALSTSPSRKSSPSPSASLGEESKKNTTPSLEAALDTIKPALQDLLMSRISDNMLDLIQKHVVQHAETIEAKIKAVLLMAEHSEESPKHHKLVPRADKSSPKSKKANPHLEAKINIQPARGRFQWKNITNISKPFTNEKGDPYVNLIYKDGSSRTYTISAIEKNKSFLTKTLGVKIVKDSLSALK